MKTFALLLSLPFSINGFASTEWKQLPAKFECDRIYAKIPNVPKEQYFFTDSGGGLNPFTYPETVSSWGIETPKYQEINEDGMKMAIAKQAWPSNIGWDFFPKKSEKISLRITDCSKEGNNEFCYLKSFFKDGFLGANWYADTVWILDYQKREVFYSQKLMSTPKAKALSLGFKTVSGKRTTHQPRMPVVIDGKRHDMLFDTGATSSFSDEAQKALGLSGPLCASNFLRRSVFDALLRKHSDWKVIKTGDKFSGGSDLIEVPKIKVGDHEVGPVWFAARKDAVYDNYSEEIMDKNIDGAIGGNTFKHFKVTVDYPNSKIFFEK